MKKSYLVSFLALVLVALFMVSCVQTKPAEPVYGPPVLVRAEPADGAVVEHDWLISWEFRAGDLQTAGRGAAPTIVKSSLFLKEAGAVYGTPVKDVTSGAGSLDAGLEEGKTYNYYLVAEDSKGKKTIMPERTFSVKVTEPVFGAPEVALVAPAADAMNVQINTTLTWEATAGAEEARGPRELTAMKVYYGKLADGYPTTPVVLNGDVRSLPVVLDYSTVYVWKVVAEQNGEPVSTDSGYQQFTTMADPAAQPELPKVLDFTVNGTEVVDGSITVVEGSNVTVAATAFIDDHTQNATMSIKIEISDGSSNTVSCVSPTQYASGCCDPYIAISDSVSFDALPLNCGDTEYTATISTFRCVENCANIVPGEVKTFTIKTVHNQPTLENATATFVSQCNNYVRNITVDASGNAALNIKVLEDTLGATLSGLEAIAEISKFATSDLLVAYEVAGTKASTESIRPAGASVAAMARGTAAATMTWKNENWKNLGADDGIWIAKDTTATLTFAATDTFCPGETWTVVVTVTDEDYSALEVSLNATKFYYFKAASQNDDKLYADTATLTVVATHVDQVNLWTYLDQADGGREKYQLSSGIIMPPCNTIHSTLGKTTGNFLIGELFPNANGDIIDSVTSMARATYPFADLRNMDKGTSRTYHLEGQEINNSSLIDEFDYQVYAVNATGTMVASADCGCENFNGTNEATEIIFTNDMCGVNLNFASEYWPTHWLNEADNRAKVELIANPDGAVSAATVLETKSAASNSGTLKTCTGYATEGAYTFKGTHYGTTNTAPAVALDVTTAYATVVFDTTAPEAAATDDIANFAARTGVSKASTETAATLTFYATDNTSNLGTITATVAGAEVPATVTVNLVPGHGVDGVATDMATAYLDLSNLDGATLTTTFTAKDRACNETVVATKYFIDNVAPTVTVNKSVYIDKDGNPVTKAATLLSPIATPLINDTPATFVFDLADHGLMADASVVVAGAEAASVTTISTGYPTDTAVATVSLKPAASGDIVITINATDVLGNVLTKLYTVKADTDGPTVTGMIAYDVTSTGKDRVTVSFNEDVDKDTLAGTITVAGGPQTFTTMTKSESFAHTYVYEFPSNSFGTGVEVKLELADSVTDTLGNKMGETYSATTLSVVSNLSSVR